MKTMYIIVTFVAFICCGMLAIDGFFGQLSPIMAGAGYAMLAIVCAITMAKAIISKDEAIISKDEADEKGKTTR